MRRVGMAVCGVLAGFFIQQAAAVEIRVLSAGAIEPGMTQAIAAFQQETGHQVRLTFNTAPQIRKRITEGESWDVLVAPPALLDELSPTRMNSAERVHVGRVGLGVVVRPGAPVPDISSVEALKLALMQAESLVFNRASTGLYLEDLLRKMGIWTAVEGKATRYPDGASVLEHVLHGKGREIGFGAITEILLYREKGLTLSVRCRPKSRTTPPTAPPPWRERKTRKWQAAWCATWAARRADACLPLRVSSLSRSRGFNS